LKGRQPIFTTHECEQLSKSWLGCSLCSISGTKSKVFWEKLTRQFNIAKDVNVDSVKRTLRSLGFKWSELSRNCNKLTWHYLKIRPKVHISQKIEVEKVEKALLHYSRINKQGKPFSYMGCCILKGSPKWQLPCVTIEKTIDIRVNSRKKVRTLMSFKL
jgi:hypothetical protein